MMSDAQESGFWLRLEGGWQQLEIDSVRCLIMPDWSGTASVTFLLTDADAAMEPLPLLAQRFAADALRYRTPTFSLEAAVRLKGCERRANTASYRALMHMGETAKDSASRDCTAVVAVEFDLR
jgi:hypothetical protein